MCHIYVCFSKTILIELHILLRDFLFPDIFMFLVAVITEMFTSFIILNRQGFEYRKVLVSKKNNNFISYHFHEIAHYFVVVVLVMPCGMWDFSPQTRD